MAIGESGRTSLGQQTSPVHAHTRAQTSTQSFFRGCNMSRVGSPNYILPSGSWRANVSSTFGVVADSTIYIYILVKAPKKKLLIPFMYWKKKNQRNRQTPKTNNQNKTYLYSESIPSCFLTWTAAKKTPLGSPTDASLSIDNLILIYSFFLQFPSLHTPLLVFSRTNTIHQMIWPLITGASSDRDTDIINTDNSNERWLTLTSCSLDSREIISRTK